MPSRTAEELWADAIAASHDGRVADSIRLYRRILEDFPHAAAADAAREYLSTARDPGVKPAVEIREAETTNPPTVQLVRVVDIDISFGQLVALFVKAAIAVIPAAIILGVIGFFVLVVFAALFGRGL